MSNEKTTHGVSVFHTDERGIKRAFHLLLTDAGNYQLHLETIFTDDEPLTTTLGLSRRGVELLADVLMEGAHNMDRWPLPPQSPDELVGPLSDCGSNERS